MVRTTASANVQGGHKTANVLTYRVRRKVPRVGALQVCVEKLQVVGRHVHGPARRTAQIKLLGSLIWNCTLEASLTNELRMRALRYQEVRYRILVKTN